MDAHKEWAKDAVCQVVEGAIVSAQVEMADVELKKSGGSARYIGRDADGIHHVDVYRPVPVDIIYINFVVQEGGAA